jgi:hypothetical protein
MISASSVNGGTGNLVRPREIAACRSSWRNKGLPVPDLIVGRALRPSTLEPGNRSGCPTISQISQRLFRFFVGNFLRFVFANSRNCFSLIDLAICLEAPLSDFLERFPRFAASAAPAAICCFFDLAGIQMFRSWKRKRICFSSRRFCARKDKPANR